MNIKQYSKQRREWQEADRFGKIVATVFLILVLIAFVAFVVFVKPL